MPRFLFGDELGNIKSLQYSSEPAGSSTGLKSQVDTLSKGSGAKRSVQGLAVAFREGDKLVCDFFPSYMSDRPCSRSRSWKASCCVFRWYYYCVPLERG
jgi:hypothetical protein